MKGEIQVEKGDFRVILGVLRGLDLVWESPTRIWEKSPKKKSFFGRLPLEGAQVGVSFA